MIKYTAHVVDDSGYDFYKNVEEHIVKIQNQNLVVEVQYQMTIRMDGKVIHAAYIIGRHDYSKISLGGE